MFKDKYAFKPRNKSSFLRGPNPINSVALTIVLVASCFAVPSVHAQATPDINKLQQQLETLQNQIESLHMQKKGAVTDQDTRVRSVGSQRAKRPQRMDDEPLQIRLYDLSDLFVVSPSYPAKMPNEFTGSIFEASTAAMTGGIGQGGGGFGGGQGGAGQGMGGGGGGVFRMAPAAPGTSPAARKRTVGLEGGGNMRSAQVSMSQLVNTIKETVEPSMWGNNQGEARVQFLGNTLLITATDSMHSQITNLLNLFREHWGKRKTISIQTFWIRAQPGDTVDLLDEKSSEVGAGVVDADKWKQYLAAARTEKRFAYSATLTGHNNQTLHALSGEQRQLIVGAKPFLKTEAAMWFENVGDVEPFGNSEDDDDMDLFNRTRKITGFHPIRQSFQSGAVIQVTPLATRGGNFVILDLQARFNQLSEPGEGAQRPTVFVTEDKQRAEVKLDHADFVTCRLNTTLRCPKEQVVLAGSMTLDPNSEMENPNIYLFVKTSVHTITEDKSDWVPENSRDQGATKKEVDEKPADKPQRTSGPTPETGQKKK